jgi:putative aldouronate transport system permease protein
VTKNSRGKKFNPNALSLKSELAFHLLLLLFSLSCIIPFLFVIIISLTDEMALVNNGYSFFPEKLTLEGYRYIFKNGGLLVNSYLVSIFITVVGTILSLIVTSMYAYALFRKCYRLRGLFTGVAVFTMLFAGGLVPYYVTVTQLLHLQNSVWSLILPGVLSAFNIIIFRTFFTTTIHEALIDSAIIDGCGEFGTYVKIAMPLSLPGIATIGLFSAIGFWNEWFNALLFISDAQKIPIQYLLIKIQRQMDFLIKNNMHLSAADSSQALASIPHESARMVMVVLIVLPIACAYPFFQRYFVQGLTIGSIKG